jgi:hypothetical protein
VDGADRQVDPQTGDSAPRVRREWQTPVLSQLDTGATGAALGGGLDGALAGTMSS